MTTTTQDRHRGGRLLFVALLALLSPLATDGAGPRFQISDDRELKEIDLASWNCTQRPEGSARTPDGSERNRLKNRGAPDIFPVGLSATDTAGFLKRVADFDAKTKGKRRKDLEPALKPELDALEKQVVQLTGYLVLAYCGPTETTNCGSVDFHDWHLEIFEKPADHPPKPGDPTPVVCEITPRTQNAIYRDKVRIQEMTAFLRRADLEYEPTGHPARQIRLTGYLLWDDEHNGPNDVGTTIRTIGANRYHNPWRAAAWEIHPVFKIEMIDGKTPSSHALPKGEEDTERQVRAAPNADAKPSPESPPPAETETSTPLTAATAVPPQQVVTIVEPVKIKIPYGETVIPRGARVPIVSRDGQTIVVDYMGGKYTVPISSTDVGN